MSVGLSVDFVVHFGVGYIHADSTDIDYERKKVKNRYLPSDSPDNLEVQTSHSKSFSFNLYEKKKKILFCISRNWYLSFII
jgi:hypothetical protein